MDENEAVPRDWRDFVAQYWAQKPYAGDFFAPPPFDADALWQIALRAGHESKIWRDDGRVILDPERYFPRPEDGGFDGYGQRLGRMLPDGGLFQQYNLQSVDVAVYDWAREFLHGLFDALGGMPPVRSVVEVMFGHYETTAIGIHNGQPGTVFLFVLDGRKRMLLWPPGTEGIKERTFDYDALRDSAHVQEGSNGSVCSWPGDWWHVGESPYGQSLSLHLFVQGMADFDIGWDALGRIDSGYEIDRRLPPTGAAANELASSVHARVLAQLNTPEARQQTIEAHMRRLSAVCLEKAPRMAPLRPPRPGEVVAVDPRFPILLAETAPGRMSCAASGHMFRFASSERLARLVERLNTGEPVDVRTLCAEFGSGRNSDALDSDTLLDVLTRLLASRTLRPVAPVGR